MSDNKPEEQKKEDNKRNNDNRQKQYVKKGSDNQTQDQKKPRNERQENNQNRRGGQNKDGERREGGRREGEQRDGQRNDRRNNNNNNKESSNDQEEKPQRPQRQSKYNFDRESITLDTIIPTIPKESDQLKKPLYEDLQAKWEKVDKEIEHIRKNKNQQIQKLREEKRQKKQAEVSQKEKLQPLKERIKLKIEESNSYKKIFDEIRGDYQQANNKYNKIKEELEAIKSKMKKPENLQRVKQQIDEIERSLANDRLKPDQEKRLHRELDELYQTLPLCEPLEAKNKELEQVKILRNQLREKKDIAYDDWQDVEDEVEELKKQQKDTDVPTNQPKEDIIPIIKEREAEANEKIAELIEQKNQLKVQHEEAKQKYYEEQDLIHYVKWAKRVQDNLRRIQENEARQEQRIEIEVQEEIKRQLSNQLEEPFKEEIATCAVLVHYLRGLIPSKKQAEEEVQKKEIDLNALKKEKLEVVVSKRDKVEETNQKGKKGKKPAEKKTQQNEDTENTNLYHNYQITASFESVSVSAPQTVDQIQEAIEKLEMKRIYFEKTKESEEQKLDEIRNEKIEKIRQEVTQRVKARDEEFKRRNEGKGGFRGGDFEDRGGRGDRGGKRQSEEDEVKQPTNKTNTLRQQKQSIQTKIDSEDFPQIQ